MIGAVLLAILALLAWPDPYGSVTGSARVTVGRRAGGPGDTRGLGEPDENGRDDPSGGARSVRDVADAALLIALSLRSGAGVVDSLERVVAVSAGAVAHDLDVVATALRWDRSTQEAWSFAHPVWGPVATALAVAADTGAAPADAVAAAATELRAEAAHVQESAAARASVLLVLPLGVLFLPAFVATAVVPVVLALATGSLSG